MVNDDFSSSGVLSHFCAAYLLSSLTVCVGSICGTRQRWTLLLLFVNDTVAS